MRYKELAMELFWDTKDTGRMAIHVRSLSRALAGTTSQETKYCRSAGLHGKQINQLLESIAGNQKKIQSH